MPRKTHGNHVKTKPMSTKQIILITISLLAHASVAVIGDTMKLSEQRYGKATGKFDSANKMVRIYETTSSKITETYNLNGICIDSDIKRKNPLKTATIRSYQPRPKTSRTIQINRQSGTHSAMAPPVKPATQKKNLGRIFAPTQKKSLKRFTLYVLGFTIPPAIIGLIWAMLKKQKEAPIPSTNTEKEVKALCDFFQRKQNPRTK